MRSTKMNRSGLLTVTAVRILLLFFILLFSACSGGSGGSDTSPSEGTNNPPQVNAGEDQVISLLIGTIQLNAAATDDSLPEGSTLTYTWTQGSGPGNVSFNEANGLQTSVTFVSAGSYVLQLTVSDGELSGSDTVTITVNEEDSETDPTVEIPRSVSRISGVAPLSVHFTAGFSSSTSSERSFHEYDYSWDFGDTASGVWGTTNKSKNSAKGPVAAHIFETPGDYTVTLTIKDGSGVRDTDTFDITVTDPDIVFSGDNTTCVSIGTDFTGAPDNSRHVTTTTLSTVTQYAGPGKRLLFKRGDSWSTEGLIFPNGGGECVIGAFGPGIAPSAQGIFTNAPEIEITSGNFLSLTLKQDWRIMDLHYIEPTGTLDIFNGAYDLQQILFLRLHVEGGKTGVKWSHYNNSSTPLIIDQMVIAQCHLTDSQSYSIYAGGERLALLGNIAGDTRRGHIARVWQGYNSVISHNIFSGSGLIEPSGSHALKLHGPGDSTKNGTDTHNPPVQGTSNLENRTEFTVISDNIFGSSGPWPVAIGPHSTDSDAEIWDIIFERNRIVSEYGIKSPDLVDIALNIWGRFITVRNNLFDGTGSRNDYTAINVGRRGYEVVPLGNHVYNNTIYRSDNTTGNYRKGINVVSSVSDSRIINNLVSFPGASVSIELIEDASSDLIESNNLLTDTPGFIDPDNLTPSLRDFSLEAGSPAIDQGTDVPVFDDLTGDERTGSDYEIGAFEY